MVCEPLPTPDSCVGEKYTSPWIRDASTNLTRRSCTLIQLRSCPSVFNEYRLKWYLPRTNAQSISSKIPCPWERIRPVSWFLWWKDWMDAQVQIQCYFHIEWATCNSCNVHNSPRISGQGIYSLLSENAMHWVEGLKKLQKSSFRVG